MPGLLDFMGLGNMPEGGVGGLLGMLAPPNDPTVPKSAPGAGGGGLPGILAPPFDPMAGPQAPDSPALRPDEYGRAPGAGAPAAPAVAPNPLAGPAALSGGSDPSLSPRPVATTAVPGVNPAAAQPTAGQQPPLQLTPPSQTPAAQVAQSARAGGGGLLDRVQSFLTRNKNALAGMGAGLAGAPNWGAGISRGMQGNIAGGQLDRQQQGENLTEQALVGKGFSPTEAAAAARNPKLLSAILPQAFAQPSLHTFTDMYGNQSASAYDPRSNTMSKPTEAPPGAVRVYSTQQVDALPSGATFIDPYGRVKVKP